MADPLILPTRNVLSVVGRADQRMIKWFEDASSAVNALASGATGTGGILDMGDRIAGSSVYDGGSRV